MSLLNKFDNLQMCVICESVKWISMDLKSFSVY